jgi:hypothetical protein
MSNFAALVAQWGTALDRRVIRHYTAATAPILAENSVGFSKPVLHVFPALVLRCSSGRHSGARPVFPITLPPLHQRLEDIAILVAHFANSYAKRMSKQISGFRSVRLEALLRYPWPGNIRELQNFVEWAVIVTMGDVLQLPALPRHLPNRIEPVTLAEAERDHVLNALQGSNWVVGGASGAAARLRVPRTTLIAKMRRGGLSRPAANCGFWGSALEFDEVQAGATFRVPDFGIISGLRDSDLTKPLGWPGYRVYRPQIGDGRRREAVP